MGSTRRPLTSRIALGLALTASFAATAVFGVGPARAAEPQQLAAVTLSEQDKNDLARVQSYLNDIRTVQSTFVQVAPDGSVAQGTLYISRPGKMRVEYDPPVKMLMVATGIYLIYYDGELDQTTYLPQRATPASLLLKENLDLQNDVEVTGIERQPGVIRVSVIESGEDGGEGGLTLTFSDKPLELRQWVVTDAQGQATKLALLNPRFDADIPEERFFFVSPGKN